MESKKLFNFIEEFNKEPVVDTETILNGLKTLTGEDRQLFMLLVNYKNGKEFLKKLDGGEI
ncbi:MAG: hypothetical protein IJ538_01620 [Clostridia bacterium]|nr:hypothetical protein [Clostridia bacterium]